MDFRAELSAQATRDIAAIFDGLLSEHAGPTGERWFLTLREAIATLGTFPSRCPLAPENQESPVELRQLLYGRKPHVYRPSSIERDHGVFVFPDTNAQGFGEKPQHVYSVRFSARELWGEPATPKDTVEVNMWDDLKS